MRPILFAAFFASMFAGHLPAQVLKLNRGDLEVGLHGQFDQGTKAIGFRFGAFADDYLQVGTNLDFQNSNFAERMGFNLFVIRLLETRLYLIPYVGASLGYGSLEIGGGDSESGAEFHILTGLKYYLSDNISLNTELHYGVSSAETFLGDRESSSSEIGLRIGFAYLW